MASTPVTRATLVTRALARADFSQSAFISASEASQLVDTSLAKFYNLLVGLYEDYFMRTDYVVTIVGGQDTYATPPDLFKLAQVWYQDSSGYRVPLRRLNLQDLTNLPIAYNTTAVPLGYVLRANAVVLYPKPLNTQPNTLVLWYVPQYVPPLADNEPVAFQIVFGWDEWVVNDVAAQIKVKAAMPADDIQQERAMIEQRIRHEAKQRNSGDPPKVRDSGWSGSSPYQRWGQFSIK